jgi:hypothetical protein
MACDEAIPFELAQRLRQHALGDIGDRAADLAEPMRPLRK